MTNSALLILTASYVYLHFNFFSFVNNSELPWDIQF